MMILPRQARDKHRESTQKKMPFVACRYVIVEATAGVSFAGKLDSLEPCWNVPELVETSAITFAGEGAETLGQIQARDPSAVCFCFCFCFCFFSFFFSKLCCVCPEPVWANHRFAYIVTTKTTQQNDHSSFSAGHYAGQSDQQPRRLWADRLPNTREALLAR
jgi:hypothetical protein